MLRRTQQEWVNIIQDQQASGLSVAEYGRQHNICVRNLYARRSDFHKGRLKAQTSSFVEITSVTKQTHQVSASTSGIEVEFGNVKLSLPAHTDALWLAQFAKALHS